MLRKFTLLIKKRIRKQKGKLKIAGIILLFVALGCAIGSKAHYPLYSYPTIPAALNEPHKVWLKCGAIGTYPEAVESDMYCVDPMYVEQLRVYIIELDAMVRKYEHTITTINE